MKILAPTRSLDMTRMQVEAGADEVYLGLMTDKYQTLSFNGRFKVMSSIPVQVRTDAELREIVGYCHEHGVMVNFTANAHHIPRGLEREYLEYVERGVQAGVDYLIVSNMGLIRLIQKHSIETPIVAGTFMVIPNAEHLSMLRDMGVVRAVLPHASSIDELKTMCSVEGIDVEVFCFIGGGNNCGRCMLLHSPVLDDIGPGCRAGYSIEYAGQRANGVHFLDAAADCALCSLPKLIDAGVSVIKLVGRESPNPMVNARIVSLFRTFLDGIYAGSSIKDLREAVASDELMWEMMWVPRFCEKRRCKYESTEVTASYI